MSLSNPPPESTSDRQKRRAPRELSCIPADVGTDETSRQIAMISNVSVTGALLYTRGKFAVDDDVTLTLYLDPDLAQPHTVRGRVTRIERREGAGSDVWPYEAGITFEASIAHLSAEIDEFVRRLRAAGLHEFHSKRP